MFGESLSGAVIMTFLMSMVPVIELRGALPVGVAAGLSVPAATIISIIGNMLPVPFILLLLRKVFAWLRSFPKLGGLIDRLEQRAHLKGQTVKKYRTLVCLSWWPSPCPAPAPGPARWWPAC